MNKKNIYRPGVRRRKAYWTAFVVFCSYYGLHLKSKIFGQKYWDKNISALHHKNANRVKNRLMELQGLFIKFGQLISNLSNALPNEFREPLEELQDSIHPKPYAEVRATFEAELGKTPEQVFTHFEEKALAAASIGQVHRARLGEREVVVKIQHANIEVIAEADLNILKNLVKIHSYFMDMKGLDGMYHQVRLMIEDELNYQKEAQSMQRITENLRAAPELNVVVPEVFAEYCTPRILVSAYCPGTSMSHLEEIRSWGVDLEDIATRLIQLFCKMILVDGFYHADPHPGNLLVNREGEIVLLDFGAVAPLSPQMKTAIPELIEAVVRYDTEAIVQALDRMGFISPGNEARRYAEHMINIFKKFLQEEVQLDGLNFQNVKLNSGLGSLFSIIQQVDLRDVSSTIQIPKDYILLYRTIILLLGNSFNLAPELDTLNVLKPYMKQHVMGADGGITQLIVNTLKTQLTTAVSLPNELSRLLRTANRGELEYEVRGLEKGIRMLYNLGQQFLYAFLLIVLVLGFDYFSVEKYSFEFYVMCGVGVFFVWRFLRAMLRGEK